MHPASAVMAVVLELQRQESRYGRLMYICVVQMFRCFGRGYHHDVGLWGRRLAETYCIHMQGPKDWHVRLYDMIRDLPATVLYGPTDSHFGRMAWLGHSMGSGLSSATVFEDLEWLRWYGNMGVHATAFLDGSLYPEPRVLIVALRIAILFLDGPMSRM